MKRLGGQTRSLKQSNLEPFISANFRHGPMVVIVFAGDRGEGIGARRLGCRAPSH